MTAATLGSLDYLYGSTNDSNTNANAESDVYKYAREALSSSANTITVSGGTVNVTGDVRADGGEITVSGAATELSADNLSVNPAYGNFSAYNGCRFLRRL